MRLMAEGMSQGIEQICPAPAEQETGVGIDERREEQMGWSTLSRSPAH